MKQSRALHMQNGENHLFALANIRVVISEAVDGWFAQAMEVDYFACGTSLEDVKRRFGEGLSATLKEHVKRYGTIKHFLNWAPDDVRNEMQSKIESQEYVYTFVDTCRIEDQSFQIEYFREQPKQLAA